MLLSAGHPEANEYPIGFLWEEHQLIVERTNNQLATEAIILHAVMTTAVASFGKDGGRKAQREFADLIKRLSDDGA